MQDITAGDCSCPHPGGVFPRVFALSRERLRTAIDDPAQRQCASADRFTLSQGRPPRALGSLLPGRGEHLDKRPRGVADLLLDRSVGVQFVVTRRVGLPIADVTVKLGGRPRGIKLHGA